MRGIGSGGSDEDGGGSGDVDGNEDLVVLMVELWRVSACEVKLVLRTYMRARVRMYALMCVCMCVRICACANVCTYVH